MPDMPYPLDFTTNTGSFVPTTNIWDPSEIYETNVNSDDFKELLVRLYQNLNLMANVLNSKDTGYYFNQEFATSNLYFNPASSDIANRRPGFRVTIDTGALGAGANTITLPFTLNITNLGTVVAWTFFMVSGAATNTTNAGQTQLVVPLPFAGAAGNNIEVILYTTTVVITNNSGYTFDTSNITLEYVKN